MLDIPCCISFVKDNEHKRAMMAVYRSPDNHSSKEKLGQVQGQGSIRHVKPFKWSKYEGNTFENRSLRIWTQLKSTKDQFDTSNNYLQLEFCKHNSTYRVFMFIVFYKRNIPRNI